MANKKISELTPKAAQLEDSDLVMVSDYNGSTYDTKSVTGANIRPYKTILFAISQSGTAVPTKIFSYEDEVTQTFTLGRSSVGVYTLTASSALFTSNKTFVSISNGMSASGICLAAYVVSSTLVYFTSSNGSTGSLLDAALDEAILEIKIIK